MEQRCVSLGKQCLPLSTKEDTKNHKKTELPNLILLPLKINSVASDTVVKFTS